MKTVLVTGGFDPLHSGHIEYFKAAKKLGDKLVVGLNSDDWLVRKKGRPFMPFEERAAIVKELACVDDVLLVEDDDTSNVLNFYEDVVKRWTAYLFWIWYGADETAAREELLLKNDINLLRASEERMKKDGRPFRISVHKRK